MYFTVMTMDVKFRDANRAVGKHMQPINNMQYCRCLYPQSFSINDTVVSLLGKLHRTVTVKFYDGRRRDVVLIVRGCQTDPLTYC